MDQLFWREMTEVITANFLVPFVPWIWATRAAVTAAAAASQPWWIVLLVANLAGLPALIIMTWVIRHAHGWVARQWPRLTVPPLRHGLCTSLFLLGASPAPEYMTALVAGANRCPWPIMIIVIAAGRMLHHLPIVLGGAILGHHPWFRSLLELGRHPLVMVATALIGLLYWKLQSRRAPQQAAV